MPDFLGIVIFGRPMSSYAVVAGMLAAVLLLRFASLRVIWRRAPDASDRAKARRHEALDWAIKRVAMPSLYVGFAAAAVTVLNIGGSAKDVAVKATIGLAAYFIARLVTSLMSLRIEYRPSAGGASSP